MEDVIVVVVGPAQIGQAIVRRAGIGKQVLLADINTSPGMGKPGRRIVFRWLVFVFRWPSQVSR